MLEAAPEPFGEHVVKNSVSSLHTDTNIRILSDGTDVGIPRIPVCRYTGKGQGLSISRRTRFRVDPVAFRFQMVLPAGSH